MFYLLTMELRRRRALRLRPFLQNKKAPLIKDLAEVHNTLVSGKSSNINKQQAQALAEPPGAPRGSHAARVANMAQHRRVLLRSWLPRPCPSRLLLLRLLLPALGAQLLVAHDAAEAPPRGASATAAYTLHRQKPLPLQQLHNAPFVLYRFYVSQSLLKKVSLFVHCADFHLKI